MPVTVEIELHDASGLRLPTSHKIEKYLEYAKRAEQAISEEFGQLGIEHTVVKNPGPAGKGFEPWCNTTGWWTSKKDPQVKFRYPRLGAFEIVLRCPNFAPGCGLPERIEVWSKLKTSHWPNLERLAALLGSMLRKAQEGQNVSDIVKHLIEQNDKRDRSENSRHEARSPGGVRPMYFGLTSPNRSGSYNPVESRRSRGATGGSVRSEPKSPGGRQHFGLNFPPRISSAPQPDVAAEVTMTEPPGACAEPPAAAAEPGAAERAAEETATPAEQTATPAEETALPAEDGTAVQVGAEAETAPAAPAPPPKPELQELGRRLRSAPQHAALVQPGDIIQKALKGSASPSLSDALDLEAFKTTLYSLGVFSTPFNFNGLFLELAQGDPARATLELLLDGLRETGLWPTPEAASVAEVEPPAPENPGAETKCAEQTPAELANATPAVAAAAPAIEGSGAPPAAPEAAAAAEAAPAAAEPKRAEAGQEAARGASALPEAHTSTEPTQSPKAAARQETAAAAAPAEAADSDRASQRPAAVPAVADDYASDFEDDDAKAPPPPPAKPPAPPAPAPAPKAPAPAAQDYEDEGFEEEEEEAEDIPEKPDRRTASAAPAPPMASGGAGKQADKGRNDAGSLEHQEEVKIVSLCLLYDHHENVEEEFDYVEDVDEDVAAPSDGEIDEVDDESIKTAED